MNQMMERGLFRLIVCVEEKKLRLQAKGNPSLSICLINSWLQFLWYIGLGQ